MTQDESGLHQTIERGLLAGIPFNLIIRQQPIHARMALYLGRRNIDPFIIIQLSIPSIDFEENKYFSSLTQRAFILFPGGTGNFDKYRKVTHL